MDIILGHHGTDFDSLASIVAAGKVHAGAVCVLPRGVDRSVHEFLGLYRDAFDFRQYRFVDEEKVRRVIVVDTRRASRLGPLGQLIGKPGIEVILYDHHPAVVGDITPTRDNTEAVGATVTLLVREIRQRGIYVTDVEATLFALGIYEDTGNLTFASTTVEDVLSVAYCLEHGANLDVVARFARYSMTQEQREVLNQFVLSSEHHTIHGVRIATAQARVDDYVGDVAALTNKLTLVESVEAVFTFTEMKNAVYVVGRSRTDSLDAADALAELGGAGHHRAASAVVRDCTVGEVRARLLDFLTRTIVPPPTAAEIMSSPVRTIDQDMTVSEAHGLLVRYGHGGLPVVRDGAMVGMISRKDVDVARMHGLGHAPVRGYMARQVITAEPSAPAPDLQRLMFEHGVGRIPIMDGTQLVGIVSRADLRRSLYGTRQPTPVGGSMWCGIERLEELMAERLRPELLRLLYEVGRLGDELSMNVFLVGGAVRDLLLEIGNFDLDLLVVGDGIAFAERLSKQLSGRCHVHERFGTASLVIDDAIKVDVASARTEHYARPAALPDVEMSSLKDDLFRRDFTINAMAVQLNMESFGRLIDYFGGRADLEQGLVRVLHNLSFVDDPTRIFRAIRFEQRHGFTIEPQTEALLTYALESHFVDNLSTQRVRDELVLLFSEPDPIPAIHRLAHLGVLEHIHRHLVFDEAVLDELRRTAAIVQWCDSLVRPVEFERWPLFLLPLLRNMTPSEVRGLGRRLRFPQGIIDVLSEGRQAAELLLATLDDGLPLRPSMVYGTLADLPLASVVHLAVCSQPESYAETRVLEFLQRHQHVHLAVRGEDLLRAGYRPGPEFGEVLRQLLAEKLDGGIESEEHERRRLFEIADVVAPRAQRRQDGAPVARGGTA